MLETMENIPLFTHLEPEQIELLQPLFERYSCPANTLIFSQNSRAEYLYLILDGVVQIEYKPYDGPQIKLTKLSHGDVFGWSAVVGPQYTSSAVSDSAVEALRIRGSDLRTLVNQHPASGQTILDLLARFVSSRWKNAQTQVQSILKTEFPTPTQPAKPKEVKMETNDLAAKEVQIKNLLERLSAYVEQFHGGTVDFISFDGKDLKVRLGGACLECPLQPATLHGWVAGTVHQFFPEVNVIEEK